MNKQDFLTRLEEALAGLPEEERAERLAFYGEMIDDRIEEGLTEEEAVAELGPIELLPAPEAPEAPALPGATLILEQAAPKRRMKPWEIVLLVLGFPLWLPLLIAAFAVALSLVIVLWSLMLSLWAVWLSLGVSAVTGAVGGVLMLLRGESAQGVVLLSAALVLAGLTIFLFFGCRAATRGAAQLTASIARGFRKLFRGKENRT